MGLVLYLPIKVSQASSAFNASPSPPNAQQGTESTSMCGINGILAYHIDSAPVCADELVACRDYMAARGPDGQGLWVDDDRRIGLAHRRLSIIDLDQRASQPMHTVEAGLVIVFNGEIYNYKELRSELQQKGARFRTTSDTEVLLHLYRDCGERMVDQLRGMFAFAIWDAGTRELFLARDPYGIKPLYYADDGKTFRFASQVRALTAGGGVSRDPSAAGWAGYYVFGSVPEPFTTYAAVRSLPAGATLRVTRHGKGEPKAAYSISDTFRAGEALPECRTWTDSQIQEEVREALLDSVKGHLVSDVPVGAFLSGGIDSGALVGLMRDAGQDDIQTLTLAFDEFRGQSHDEEPTAAKVARTYGTRHSLRIVNEGEFIADLPRIMAAMDQPTIDGLNTWFIAKAAQEQGIKVVMSGLGGDELFGGYPSFRQIPQSVRWFGPMRHTPAVGKALRQAFNFANPARLGFSVKASGLVELGGTYPGAYLLRRGLFMPWEIDGILPPEFARQGLRELMPLDLIGREISAGLNSEYAKVATLEASLYMRNQLLKDTDWTSMAHSLEVRVPLVDRMLLERLARIPLGSRRFAGKKLLRLSPRNPLPEIVGSRPKSGFLTPIDEWISRMPAAMERDRGVDRQHWSRRWAVNVASMWQAGS